MIAAVAAVAIAASAIPAAASVPAAAAPARPARPASSGPAPTVVSFTWGGGFANQLGALPLYRRYHMHATFYVPSGLVCLPSADPGCTRLPYLTLADVRKIAAGGNEIGGLSVEHIPLTGLPAAEAQREICDDRVNLTRWGFRVTDFAYPFGLVNRTLQQLAQRCGYNSGLGTGQLRGAGLCTHCPFAETIPPQNPYVLRTPIEVASVGTRWTPRTFEAIVNGARRHGGGWVIFTLHDVCAHSCALGVTLPELTKVLRFLARLRGHGVSVKTVRQVVGGPVRPAVPGPQPQPMPQAGIRNSLLTTTSANGVPACFQAAHYGDNTSTFSYRRHGGPGGDPAEVIAVTKRTSGTAQLLPALDLGACAPSVSAGRSYTVSAWYTSTVPAEINVYYRTSLGTWRFWQASTTLTAQPHWTRASWTTSPVPSGASALSFSIAPRAAGTVATSRYRLSPAGTSPTALIILLAVIVVMASIEAGFTISDRLHRRRARSAPGNTEGS